MDSLTWTQEQSLLPEGAWLARGCGCAGGIVVGSVTAVVLWLGLGLEWWWGVAAWVVAFALGRTAGRALQRQLQLTHMAFTPSQLRLTSMTSSASTTVDLAELIEINVRHWGETVTTLEVRFAKSSHLVRTVSVTNRHDPTLAGRLAELLGPGISIQETTTNPVQ
ncbi:hypothetical protein ABZ897_26930 [Nonomuraea sp. NPDC046802]|uniref:hypothetical protein n=1 Tax=Nonomuraea sp. NPDC046802 TaxID=3154919 RepID=UPI003403BAD0